VEAVTQYAGATEFPERHRYFFMRGKERRSKSEGLLQEPTNPRAHSKCCEVGFQPPQIAGISAEADMTIRAHEDICTVSRPMHATEPCRFFASSAYFDRRDWKPTALKLPIGTPTEEDKRECRRRKQLVDAAALPNPIRARSPALAFQPLSAC